jgi:hypothetical protein
MRKTYLMALAAGSIIVLADCGGGSDAAHAIQGQWEGSLYLYPINGDNNYNDYRIIVMDNDSLWGTLSRGNSTTSSNIQSMFHGSGSSGSSDDSSDNDEIDFDTSFTQFNFIGGAANSPLGFSGTVNGTSLDGRFSYGTSFKLSFGSYVQAASLASIAGVYSGYSVISGSDSRYNLNSITISGSTLTLPADANGCSASGTLTPHQTQAPNGLVAVFDTTLTFSGAGCPLGNGTTIQGITYQTQFADAANAIQILAVTPDNQTGFMVTGVH